MLGKHMLKSWSSTPAMVALSSGEAEFYGVTNAAGIGIGYQSLLKDLGIETPIRVWTDSTPRWVSTGGKAWESSASLTLGACGCSKSSVVEL